MQRRDFLKLVGLSVAAPTAALSITKKPAEAFTYTGHVSKEELLMQMRSAVKKMKWNPPLKNK